MTIQRMSDQHKIKFLDGERVQEENTQSTLPQKTVEQIAEEQKSRSLSHIDNGFMTAKHIASARTGVISDQGSPSKYIKSESANNIWDNDKTEKASKEIDSKTKTMQEKEEIFSNRREAENKRMQELTENLKSTIQDKASSISPAGNYSGTNYKTSSNNLSIFDNEDFSRLQNKTGGEQVSEDVAIRRGEVDDSWRSGGKCISSSDMKKKLFDGFFTGSE